MTYRNGTVYRIGTTTVDCLFKDFPTVTLDKNKFPDDIEFGTFFTMYEEDDKYSIRVCKTTNNDMPEKRVVL